MSENELNLSGGENGLQSMQPSTMDDAQILDIEIMGRLGVESSGKYRENHTYVGSAPVEPLWDKEGRRVARSESGHVLSHPSPSSRHHSSPLPPVATFHLPFFPSLIRLIQSLSSCIRKAGCHGKTPFSLTAISNNVGKSAAGI